MTAIDRTPFALELRDIRNSFNYEFFNTDIHDRHAVDPSHAFYRECMKLIADYGVCIDQFMVEINRIHICMKEVVESHYFTRSNEKKLIFFTKVDDFINFEFTLCNSKFADGDTFRPYEGMALLLDGTQWWSLSDFNGTGILEMIVVSF
jgi:hypothetical protein